MAAKIRKGDKVVVTSGSDKGKFGVVKSVCPNTGRAIVEGINISRKFKKTNSVDGSSPDFIERSIHLSNLSFFDKTSDKPSRVYFFTNKEGKKVRTLRKSGEVIDV